MRNIGVIGNTNLSCFIALKNMECGNNVLIGIGKDGNSNCFLNPKFYNSNFFLSYHDVVLFSDIIFICEINSKLNYFLKVIKELKVENKIFIDCTVCDYSSKMLKYNYSSILNIVDSKCYFKAFTNLGLNYPLNDRMKIIRETYITGEKDHSIYSVNKLIQKLGFKPIYIGDNKYAGLLESFYHLISQIRSENSNESSLNFILINI